MAVANALAYYYRATITGIKCFIVEAPGVTKKARIMVWTPGGRFSAGSRKIRQNLLQVKADVNVIKLFTSVIYEFS
jgi:hypothetical protein